jgi:Family of unknown function (DUF6299)
LIAAAGASIAILATQTGLALAAPPSNDLPAGADAITSIPATITQDTTEATVSTDDLGCGVGGTDQATVWYTVTLSAATTIMIDASTSDYVVGINAFSGSGTPGPLIDCAEQTLRLDVEAGTTYYVMFADIDAGANGGQLDVTIDVAPPPIQVDLTVDPSGKVNTKTGEATVTGSITCSAATSDVFVDLNLRQSVGRFTIHGFGGAGAECGPTPTAWVATIVGDNGKFGPGKATADVSAFACDPFTCGDAFVSAAVRLRK